MSAGGCFFEASFEMLLDLNQLQQVTHKLSGFLQQLSSPLSFLFRFS